MMASVKNMEFPIGIELAYILFKDMYRNRTPNTYKFTFLKQQETMKITAKRNSFNLDEAVINFAISDAIVNNKFNNDLLLDIFNCLTFEQKRNIALKIANFSFPCIDDIPTMGYMWNKNCELVDYNWLNDNVEFSYPSEPDIRYFKTQAEADHFAETGKYRNASYNKDEQYSIEASYTHIYTDKCSLERWFDATEEYAFRINNQ